MFNKRTSKEIGSSAENIAKQYLEQHGLRFIDNNFSSRFGEIDLIFREGETLVFVEVRYRKNNAYGHSIETITQSKQQKIIKTAEYYLHKNQLSESLHCRFDVIGIEPPNLTEKQASTPYSINWIKHAFTCF